jgi:transposase
MPKKFPAEFKRDVVTVARRGDLTLAEVAADFDVSVESVRRWMRQADIDDGVSEGLTTAEQDEIEQRQVERVGGDERAVGSNSGPMAQSPSSASCTSAMRRRSEVSCTSKAADWSSATHTSPLHAPSG